jgi:hypothetical protein
MMLTIVQVQANATQRGSSIKTLLHVICQDEKTEDGPHQCSQVYASLAVLQGENLTKMIDQPMTVN